MSEVIAKTANPEAQPAPSGALSKTVECTALERRLIDRYQRGFPLTPHPYADVARSLDTTEEAVLSALANLKAKNVLSRIGAAVRPHQAGWSTLAAMAVPEDRLEEVAALVSACPEVNHNYSREHRLNLWFVAAGPSEDSVRAALEDISTRTGIKVIDLPLEAAYHLDLGFSIEWR